MSDKPFYEWIQQAIDKDMAKKPFPLFWVKSVKITMGEPDTVVVDVALELEKVP